MSQVAHLGFEEERTIWLLVKVTIFNRFKETPFYLVGNTPIGSPCSSPTMGRKALSISVCCDQPSGQAQSTPSPSVLRLPRGPPDNSTKGFQ